MVSVYSVQNLALAALVLDWDCMGSCTACSRLVVDVVEKEREVSQEGDKTAEEIPGKRANIAGSIVVVVRWVELVLIGAAAGADVAEDNLQGWTGFVAEEEILMEHDIAGQQCQQEHPFPMDSVTAGQC